MQSLNRRSFIAASAGACAGFVAGNAAAVSAFGAQATTQPSAAEGSPHASFPSHDSELVRQMVGVSHGNVAAVKALLEQSPELAKAAWDWGFGDWETALGAASHVGNREIAELLIASGARPDLFTFAMLGHVDVVRAYIEAMPGIQKIHGPHGIPLLAHAEAGGEQAASVVEYLRTVGGADERTAGVPLEEALKQAYIGEYRYGGGETERLIVLEQRDWLAIERPGGSARRLTHLGKHAFEPVGSSSVRIVFDVAAGDGGAAQALRIEGCLPKITARRL